MNDFEDFYEEQINNLKEEKNNAYWERNQLVVFLSKFYKSHLSLHPEEDEYWEDDWRNLVCVHLPTGQASWHIHDSEVKYFAHLPYEPNHWDGHTTEEKYKRLAGALGY
jgi:hypothetical protein